MTKHDIRKAKNYFIKKDMQGRYILAIFLLVCGTVLFFVVLLLFFSADTTTISYSNDSISIGSTPWILIKNIVVANWILLTVGGIILILGAMVLTHRIAGSFVHLERNLGAMARGDLSEEIILRKKDEGKDLAEKINQFNKVLSGKLESINRCSAAIENHANKFTSQEPGDISPEDAFTVFKEIKKQNNKLQEQLNFFTLYND